MSTRSLILRKGDTVTVLRPRRDGTTLEILLDRQDLPLFRRFKWQRHTKGMIRYTGPRKGIGSVLLHREILKLPPDLYVVFLNDNPFDVRRSNLKVITYLEQRRKPKKNPSIRTLHKGQPTGVGFCSQTKRKPNGKTYTYRFAQAHFCYRYKQQCKRFCIDSLGLEEAVRRALAWRVQMIREHGMEPNAELLDMLERVIRMARSGGGFEEIYGGNAEYENSKVVAREVAHWAQPYEEAA